MGSFSGFNNFGDLLMDYKILQGNALDRLKELPDESVNCAVTSPPYWGLRQYLFDGAVILRNDITLKEREDVETEIARLGIQPRF